MKADTSSEVQRFYNFAPYPPVRRLMNYEHPDFSRSILNHLLRRREGIAGWFSPDMKIWVAGCGTQQAVEVGLNFPEAEVIATDLSDASIGWSKSLAEQAGVKNVTFSRGDLLESSFEREFDLVVCTGVLHHLKEPDVGLAVIHQSLKPTGCAHLFVYNRSHRAPLKRFRKLLSSLGGNSLNFPQKKAFANQLLDLILTRGGDNEWIEQLRYFEPAHIRESSEFEDTLLHPQEVDYDPKDLRSFLDRARMRHVSWMLPYAWDDLNENMGTEVRALLDTLQDEQRWDATYLFQGRHSPHLEFIATRDDSPEFQPFSDRELMSKRPLVCNHLVRSVDASGRLGSLNAIVPYRVDGENLYFISPAGDKRSDQWYGFSRKTEKLVGSCDGTRSIAELCCEFNLSEGKLLKFFREKMLPPSAIVICGTL